MVPSVSPCHPLEQFVINSLGSYVQDQLALLGWSRLALVERSGIDDWQLESILESPVLADWPTPDLLLSLARAFTVPVSEIVTHAARGCGLYVDEGVSPTETLHLISNEELMREVRRRLALGAATGTYLANPGQHLDDADSGAVT
jgi:hypothetical protein